MSVYWILDAKQNRVKVGESEDPKKRLTQLQTGNSSKLVLFGVSKLGVEKELHQLYAPFRIQGEWFEWNELIKCHCGSVKDSESIHIWLDEDRVVHHDSGDLSGYLQIQMLAILTKTVNEDINDRLTTLKTDNKELKKNNDRRSYEEGDPKKFILELIRTNTGKHHGALVNDVETDALQSGMSPEEYKETIHGLLDKGIVYEPSLGRVCLIKFDQSTIDPNIPKPAEATE